MKMVVLRAVRMRNANWQQFLEKLLGGKLENHFSVSNTKNCCPVIGPGGEKPIDFAGAV